MLDDLDKVDWNAVEHAYGPAGNIPALIRSAAGNDAVASKKAWDELWYYLFHQGTRFTASVAAIPFLLEIVGHPRTLRRRDGIMLLVHLAIGYPESALGSEGYTEAFIAQQTSEWIASTPEATEVAQCELHCYRAVSRGVPIFVSRLNARSSPIRTRAAFACAWFFDHASMSVPAIRKQVARETNDASRASMLLALSYLNAITEADVGDALAAQHPPLLRRAAAVALARHDETTTDAAAAVLAEDYRARSRPTPGWFPWQGLDRYADDCAVARNPSLPPRSGA
ncbi:hypothetical protein LZC95_14455 [Pendulispora brunnea]|uniref:HEAT repeat domain-containing protein n=1 Tax=Pendulispora brunnea TaxID=2905690 RepID=A0ABZ2KJ06_9BACT